MFKELNSYNEIFQNFSPSWFAAIMGTGILSLTFYFFSFRLAFLKPLAFFFFYFNLVFFFVLLLVFFIRLFFYFSFLKEDFFHPLQANFFPTLPIGMLVIAAGFLVISHNIFWAKVFWLIGAFLTLILSVVIPYILFQKRDITLSHINPAWFIPPVGLVVVPIAGSFLAKYFGSGRDFFLLLNYISWGSGFFIYLGLSAICLYRFILHHPLPKTLMPTIWINLGPLGAGTAALINLVKVSYFVSIKEPFYVFGLLFWGFGIWWLAIALMATFFQIKKAALPYAMSWWAFTFPLGAYIAATYSLFKIFHFIFLYYLGIFLLALLSIFWLATFWQTMQGVISGKVFQKQG